jgi:thiol-disulfide isomerase/thioredoxin
LCGEEVMMKNAVLVGCALLLLTGFASAASQAEQDKHDSRARQLLDEGKSLIDQRQFDKAITAFDEAIKLEPQWAALHLQLGKARAYMVILQDVVALEEKARAALRQAIALEPSLAEAYFQMGRLDFFDHKYDDAVGEFERAIKADPLLMQAYSQKWRALLKQPDFESVMPKIRAEIAELLKGLPNREIALEVALAGYEAIADEQELIKAQDRLIAEFPNHKMIEAILLQRLFDEKDDAQRAILLDRFIARYPQNPDLYLLTEMLFGIRARQPEVQASELLRLGEAWIQAAASGAYEVNKTRALVIILFAERRLALDRAQALADETVKLFDELQPDSPLLSNVPQSNRALLMESFKERAHEARGLLLLKRGNLEAAAKDLSQALQRVINEVEKNGFILWKDTDLRELDVRPRVLWLAELYEAQGDFKRAAKYLLAGYNDGERGNQFIRARLPILYKQLGRKQADAEADLQSAQSRFRSLMAASAVTTEETKQKYLANRIGKPAPEFKALGLDKKEIRLSDLKGKVVVLTFWATWCGPCILEMPHLQKAAEKYKHQADVVFLAVSIDANRPAVRPFWVKNGYTIRAAYDQDGAQNFQLPGVPSTFIIDRNGVIQFRDIGYNADGERVIERLAWRVDALLSPQATPGKEKSQ